MSDFEWAKAWRPTSADWDSSDIEWQAHELWERLNRERETNANG